MVGLFKRFLSGNQGQAFAIVLGLLALGGLTIAASVSYAATGLRGNQVAQEQMKAVYAAGAGAEYGIWYVKKYASALAQQQLAENISQMAVNVTATDNGSYTLYFGDMVQPKSGVHAEWLDVSGNITPAGGLWKYTIKVWVPNHVHDGKIQLERVGARLPVGYTYVPGSASSFGTNLSTADPNPLATPPEMKQETATGAWLLNWDVKQISDAYLWGQSPHNLWERTQTFYITGSGNVEGYYCWVMADPEAIGIIGEIIGTLYNVTSKATSRDGKVTATIRVDLIRQDTGAIDIMSWQVAR